MCGRLATTLPSEAMAQLFAAKPANDLPVVPNYNVCPTTQIHVVRAGENGRTLVAMRWGLLPTWYKETNSGPLLINARAETIAQKPAFRTACRERRCLIPASGFYEWTETKDGKRLPWYITRADGAPIVLAGIWQAWTHDGERHATCAVVTIAAGKTMSAIHHRVPVLVRAPDFGKWLGEEGKGASALMQPPADHELVFGRVGTAVNSNRARGPELIEPFDAE